MNTSLHDSLADIFGEPAATMTATEARIASVKEVLKRTTARTAPVEIFAEKLSAAEVATMSTPKHHADVVQGSDEWAALRRGVLTASEMKLIITPTLKVAENDKSTSHVYEIAAQRITGYVEPTYISDGMLRGQEDEIDARVLYSANYAKVREIGFVTNDSLGFTIGYSPDGLVGSNGAIECKSRRQKYQIQTIVECMPGDSIPSEYMIQIQTGMLVANLEWIDFISYSGGLPMAVVRVLPDAKIQAAIIAAATAFEAKVQAVVDKYRAIGESQARLIPTKRRVEQEVMLQWGD